MSVYVDLATWPWKGKRWGHMMADTVEELHEFAGRLGLKKDWFQNAKGIPHYDITVKKRVEAIRLGAIADTKKVVELIKGYRRRRAV